MEFLLPFAVKLFPNMLPSTFEDSFAEEEKKRKLLKLRLEMAKFLQETIEESGIPGSERALAVKEFGEFFRRIRTTGEQASTEELIKMAKLFPDQLTLENMSRPQLVCMTRYMNLNAFGTDTFLRYQIRNQMLSIKKDDQLILLEGVDSLTPHELQAACQSRGIPTSSTSPARLRSELSQWLDLHVARSIPSSLLILSRAFIFSDGILQTPASPSSSSSPSAAKATASSPSTSPSASPRPTSTEALQATLSSLPDTLLTETEFHVSELEGGATTEQKLEALKRQEELIADEKAQELKVEQDRKQRKEEARIKKEAESLSTATPDGPLPTAAAAAATATKEPIPLPSIALSDGSREPVWVNGAFETTPASVASAPLKSAVVTEKQSSSSGLVPTAGTPLTAVSTVRCIEDDEDKARMTEEQLLELREALSIMSSRSAVLEEREELEYLKENRMDYKEVSPKTWSKKKKECRINSITTSH